MLSRIGSRLTFANVTATLALVFAMSGGALAANHYLLTSTKQISPKVLKALKGGSHTAGAAGPHGPTGATGPMGATGPAGKEGAPGKEGQAGAEGKAGSPWTAGGTLPPGKTETGTWAFTKNAQGEIRVPLSFPIPTQESLKSVGRSFSGEEDPSPNCRGSVAKPEADPGFICVYSDLHEDPLTGMGPVRTSGVVLIFASNSTAAPQVDEGTWAVTAPLAPPTFAGLESATYCNGGPGSYPTSYTLRWEPATDGTTIVYDIFQATTSGGEDFSTPTYTTPAGATSFTTPVLPTDKPLFFVVRAVDQAGKSDLNTVERQGQNQCE